MHTLRIFAVVFVIALAAQAQGENADAPRRNVLFIAVDDLRTQLACYGATHIKSPNIDKLAARGVRFERAYCQQAVCNPSRTSVMAGLRPDTIGITGNHRHFRSNMPDVVTLSQHFKNHGYHAQSIGKIYHGVFSDGASITKWDTMGDPPSWSVPTTRFGTRYYYTEEGIAAAKRVYEKVYKPKNPGPDDWTKKLVFGPLTESPDVPDDTLYDGKVAAAAIATLRERVESDKPFFLAVGFIKPHTPFVAPKKYYDLYDPDDIALAPNPQLPIGAPPIAGHGSHEARRYTDQPNKGPFTKANQQRIRHGYYACISYVDAQVGRVIDELDRLGLAESTTIVLWSDHGWHLGEHGLFGKTTNFEIDTRVPLIVSTPNMKAAGRSTRALVELVDLYPTLAEICGLPVSDTLEGVSFRPLLNDPDRPWKTAAFSQFPRGGNANTGGKVMGYSMRTNRYRFTEWIDRGTGETVARELYDHAHDPRETRNLAADPSSAELVRRLAAKRAAGPDAARPVNVESASRPNVLLIVSEDNGPELGCYGDPYVKTPRLDRLAAQGVRFERAFVPYSVCSPSRACFYTGLYPHQNGQIGLATHKYAMYKNWPNMVRTLKAAGYRTGIIGKIHVNPESAFPCDFRAFPGSNFNKRPVRGFADKAAQFINASDDPFLLVVNYPDAHFPLIRQQYGLPADPLDGDDVKVLPWVGADSPRLREATANYYNCMSRLDTGVGMLLDELDASGKTDDTLVIYIGDHGAQFSRGKTSVYEAGLRIPMIVRWPGRAKAGHVRRELVSTLDLLPTVLDASGVKRPEHTLPGRALQPLLAGQSVPWREHIIGFTTGAAPALHFTQISIRSDRYKLIVSPVRGRINKSAEAYLNQFNAYFIAGTNAAEVAASDDTVREAYARYLNPPEFELYDLHADPHEWVNLAADPNHAKTLLKLREAWGRWATGTRFPLADARQLAAYTADEDRGQTINYKRDKTFRWGYLDRFSNYINAEATP